MRLLIPPIASAVLLLLALATTCTSGFLFIPKASRYIRPSTELCCNNKGWDIRLERRSAGHAMLFASQTLLLTVLGKKASAEESTSTKPFAPNENLLPAVRVKLSIEEALHLIDSLSLLDISEETRCTAYQSLSDLFLQPQNYTKSLRLQGVPPKPADRYLDSYKPMNGDLPFQLYLVKNGDVSAWKNLKKQEKMREQLDPVRAALNAYTDALTFSGDSYVLNVDRATKSSMLREDRLPDVKQVITSDMGMRYLYRNQVLTAIEDFRAELRLQLKNLDQADSAELRKLMNDSNKALERWFGLIDSNDVQLAFETVKSERK